jgi:hypothetical protein
VNAFFNVFQGCRGRDTRERELQSSVGIIYSQANQVVVVVEEENISKKQNCTP